MIHQTHFKGWAKPGPNPPGLSSGVIVEPDETLDAISGHFRLFQLRRGHRFSTDDLLVAWYGTSWCPSAHTVLDLGSGIHFLDEVEVVIGGAAVGSKTDDDVSLEHFRDARNT